MYEVIKIILEAFFTKTDFSDLSEEYKKKQLRKIGADLFLLYVHVYEMVSCGENIVNSLEHFVERKDPQAGKWMRRMVIEQRMNLIKLMEDIQRLRHLLIVLDPESWKKLSFLFYDKKNLLDELINLMEDGSFPLIESTESDIRKLIENSQGREKYITEQKLYQEMENNLILSTVPWDENIFEKIREHLEKRNPRRQLEQIRAVLQKIRIVLGNNFSIQDVLLEISYRR